MRNASVVTVVTVVTAFALSACTKSPPSPAPPSATDVAIQAAAAQPDPRVLADDQKCTSDTDCTLTTADCCGCNALGTQVGIRKDHVAALAARRAPVCGGVSCAQQMSEDPSCAATKAVCRAGACTADVAAGTKTPVEPIR